MASRTAPKQSSFLTNYFLIILFLFGVLTFIFNAHLANHVVKPENTHKKVALKNFAVHHHLVKKSQKRNQALDVELNHGSDDDDDNDNDNDDNNNNNDDDNDNNNKSKFQGGVIASNQETKNVKAAALQSQNQLPHHSSSVSHLAGLDCTPFGGPPNDVAQEMVYWEDIPQDAHFKSPFQQPNQYMTFEPDRGGWNNIRMAMETILVMAAGMGRTLVLPPDQKMYLLNQKKGNSQRHHFSFSHFFHMERISQEHLGLNIITMQEYLETVAMQGKLLDIKTKKPTFPPYNRTDWNGQPLSPLNDWLRTTSMTVLWDPEECLAVFPHNTSVTDTVTKIQREIDKTKTGFPSYSHYIDKPVPIGAPVAERLKENWAGRHGLCVYDESYAKVQSLHFPMEHSGEYKSRLLVHFYAFIFFENWHYDLWMKRFVRDHVRYLDEIQCAAAKIVGAIRQVVSTRTHGQSTDYDSFHVRRGDFQYKNTRIEADEIYKVSHSQLIPNGTIYIATDEKDHSFFDPFIKGNFHVLFLSDFIPLLEEQNVNTNYYGMIDQLVASRGRVFFGCWFSTFTGYINRLRGYHMDATTNDENEPHRQMGTLPNSYYYVLPDRYNHMRHYYPVKKSFYAREFPTSWRLIDYDID